MSIESQKEQAPSYRVLSDEEVKSLYAQFLQNLESRAKRLKEKYSLRATEEQLVNILAYAERMRVDPTAHQVLSMIKTLGHSNRSEKKLVCAIKRQMESIADKREHERCSFSTAKISGKYMRAFNQAAKKRPSNDNVQQAFGSADRVFIEVERGGDCSLRQKIAERLAQLPSPKQGQARGYTITDWVGGYAVDALGKQKYRIGALLQKHAPDLLTEFQKREAGKQIAVISRRVDDIARASTNRGWSSCAGERAGRGYAFGEMESGIAAGMMIAYLVSDKDPYANDPLARVMLSPYIRDAKAVKESGYVLPRLPFKERLHALFLRVTLRAPKPIGECIWLPNRTTYGLASDSFRKAVLGFSEDHLNKNASHTFICAPGVYQDGCTPPVHRQNEKVQYLI